MTADEFSDLLERHGSNIAEWPSPLQNEARSYARSSDQGRRLLAESRAFDALLSDSADVPTPLRLRAHILERVATKESPVWWTWITDAVWRPALLAILPLVLGFVLGDMASQFDGDSTEATMFLAFADLENLAEVNESTAADD